MNNGPIVITLSYDTMGRILTLEGEWPEHTVITPQALALCEPGIIERYHDPDEIKIVLTETWARYRVDATDPLTGNLQLSLLATAASGTDIARLIDGFRWMRDST